jgi:hypothetical protein
MALTKKNIIVGAARVYIGPATSAAASLATSKPALVAGTRYTTTMTNADGSTNTGDPTVVTNWREVGYTQDGLEVATNPTWDDISVDQLLDAAKIFKSNMGFTLNTTFAEATLENVLVAWGQDSTTISSVGIGEKELAWDGGTLGSAPFERGLIAVGNGVENAGVNTYSERVYQAYRVLSVEATSFTNSSDTATTIPVSFRALPADNGRYGVTRDRLNVS